MLSLVVEAQRARQRAEQAQRRAWEAAQADQQRAYRTAQREAASGHRAALAAYQSAREAEAARQTVELQQRIESLGRVFADGARIPTPRPEQFRVTAPAIPFDPGALDRPVVMPDPARYQVAPLSGLKAMSTAARQEHADQVARARGQLEHDIKVGQAAEAERRRQLEAARRQHQAWLSAQHQRAADRNTWVDNLVSRLRAEEPEAVTEYFTAVLYVGAGWPAQFPRAVAVDWDQEARQLIVGWALPGFEIVPDAARVRYVKSHDEFRRMSMPGGQRSALYRAVICQSSLRVICELFRADHYGLLASIVFNGYVVALDPATGQETERYLITAMISREDVAGLRLADVDAEACLRRLRAQVSARAERLEEVRTGRRAGIAAATIDGTGGAEWNLHDMDPGQFEELVADLFRARNLEVTTTARSGDGGVDVEARDPDPLTGGLILIQVKRYRATVSPSVVRDLYGVVQHRGATKGILVTTSGFGPGSYEFARGKALTLINGTELTDLLARHELRHDAADHR
ncbi:restriction endonuclease [Cryptosporangium sp. NPDC051539]|uniref:restriction endonuclease n=1 Tax=Cryptosporangium sp. NPDC051539 TaxID=3363962 RepID=UPI0037A2C9A8